MKFFVALCILITLQLCLIRASEVEEQNVEDQNVEVAEDYMDIDTMPGDLRAKPKHKPFCERTYRPGRGLGGQCLYPAQLLNQSCEFIINEVPGNKNICYDGEEYCCVDCNVPILNATCHDRVGDDTASRRICCPGEKGRGLLVGGCRCCGPCKITRRCRIKKQGFCVAKYDEKKNYEYCTEKGGKIYPKLCKGGNCACCGFPHL